MGRQGSSDNGDCNSRCDEQYLSQIPALQQLINLGFQYLAPKQLIKERGGKHSNVLLEEILRKQLKVINRIQYRGGEYRFSEENIQSAIEKLKYVSYDGLQRTNEAIYDLLSLGIALEQSVEGNAKSFNLHYINWKCWDKNLFHVAAEFKVTRSRGSDKVQPDIVLFVNGIPFATIECESPNTEVKQAIEQSIRYQGDGYIPKLFTYVQQVLAVNANQAYHATAGTPARFWAVWQEQTDSEAAVAKSINSPLTDEEKNALFSGRFAAAREYFDTQGAEGEREVSVQDRALYSLCRPERLLELAYKFTVVEGGLKKIARYQQYFVIKSTLERVKQLDGEGRRRGGIIWHTQGSGKSLTMVMLARNLALDPAIVNPRIVLVTDRDDLDRQLGNTFSACGLDPCRATSGRHLLELVSEQKAGIVTTLIHKFHQALNVKKHRDESADIFMLVDESHRTNFGLFSARMRQMFPNACYLGFTGTPLLKKEKNSFTKFGGLIEPHYSITQAVNDHAVVPLLYEGRHVEMLQNQEVIDLWFERRTTGLTKEQQADLKRKYTHAAMLSKADQVIYMHALDISMHYRSTWQGSGFKAQLVAPSKAAALKYHRFLAEIGAISSAVIISPPESREGYDEGEGKPSDEVISFWQAMMKRYGSEEEYVKQTISQFKSSGEPEILIVVDKLLTGFDAPRNTVLYLCAVLREHTLLQAIARVNRLYENKEFGYIVDYASVLGELDKALTMYSAFEGFDENDLKGALTSIKQEVAKLPQCYSDLWELFNVLDDRHDEEACEVLLADDARREAFYQRLADYSRVLGIALSTEQFTVSVSDAKLKQYKEDLKRFYKLKAAVKLRYAEAVDYRDYEPKIKKLLDTHIQANEVVQLNKPVNIFDEKMFRQIKDDQGVYATQSVAAKADAIAHATKKAITERMDEDPAFYQKFSTLIQQVIDNFRAQRISELEYLNTVSDLRGKVVTCQHDDAPDRLEGNEDAMAFYGVLQPFFDTHPLSEGLSKVAAVETALAIQKILRRHWKVQFWDDDYAQKCAENDIDDYLFDYVKGEYGVELSLDQMDEIIERSMQIARHRMPG
ncbi:MAG: HsdR family type I site-specific deoxyribonuclease [Chromatiales bacterium]|nr:HsdR family type I site-specific deoxyribonuclease [Chromatiales bacterium]